MSRAVAGPQALADITRPLTADEATRIEQILADHAFHADGSIADQAAYDRMLELAGQEQGR